MDKEKEKALELAVSQIERQFGKGSIMKLGEAHSRLFVESIPTGSIALDIALGVGGIPVAESSRSTAPSPREDDDRPARDRRVPAPGRRRRADRR